MRKFQTINGLTKTNLFMPNLKQKPNKNNVKSMSQIQAQRRGNLGFNRSSLSPQKDEKQSEKLNKELFEN